MTTGQRMPRMFNLLLITALVAPLAAGCGPKRKKKEVRSEKGLAKLTEVMEARRKRMLAKLPPADVKGDAEQHPWLAWVNGFAGSQSKSEFKKVAVLASGTDIARAGEALATWLGALSRYYRDEKMAPREYYRDLSVAARASKDKPWAQDLEFERLFFHAAEAARTHDLFAEQWGPQDDRVTRYFTYWRLIFGFEAESSLFQEETNKFCKTMLGDYCKEIPMEQRPFQVMKPYYERVIAEIDNYKKQFPQSPWNAFLDRIAAQYAERIKRVPKWAEIPVLAPIRSTVAAPVGGNAVLYIEKDGIALMENVLRRKDVVPKELDEKGVERELGPAWQPDWTTDKELERQISVLVEDVRSSTVSQFNQSTVLLVTRSDVPVSFIQPALQATIIGPHAKEWPTAMLVGRRRGDGSNRRAGYLLSMIAGDKTVKFKLTPPGQKKSLTCVAWANVGKQTYEAKGFAPVVWHDGEKVWTGKLATDGAFRDAQGEPGHGEGPRLETWAERQSTSIVVAVPPTATYANLLEGLNGVAHRCEKDDCLIERNQPVFVATCQ